MSHKALAVKWGRRRRFQEPTHGPWLIFARKKKMPTPTPGSSGSVLPYTRKKTSRSMPGLPGKIGEAGSCSHHIQLTCLSTTFTVVSIQRKKPEKDTMALAPGFPSTIRSSPTRTLNPRPLRVLESYEPGPSGQHTPTYSHHHHERIFQTRDHVSQDTWKEFRASIGYTFQRGNTKFWVVFVVCSKVSIVYSVSPKKTGTPRPPNPPSSLNPRQGRQKGIHHKGERKKRGHTHKTESNKWSTCYIERDAREKKKVSFRVLDGKTREVCSLVSCKVR
ncbi:hypothetical protein GQ607_015473 [Colletotrichum asianum]|uniref:Uncharacterized protein n=1 Tax=Colletotrichum asianum TaxID=702518 RepID=A0A8H3ZIL8_9PEZI|nr:hypothetical protein GQ607_015473 [Colletotrichum asianum]